MRWRVIFLVRFSSALRWLLREERFSIFLTSVFYFFYSVCVCVCLCALHPLPLFCHTSAHAYLILLSILPAFLLLLPPGVVEGHLHIGSLSQRMEGGGRTREEAASRAVRRSTVLCTHHFFFFRLRHDRRSLKGRAGLSENANGINSESRSSSDLRQNLCKHAGGVIFLLLLSVISRCEEQITPAQEILCCYTTHSSFLVKIWH